MTWELVATFLLIRTYFLLLKRVAGRVLATTRLGLIMRLVGVARRVLVVLAITRLGLIVRLVGVARRVLVVLTITRLGLIMRLVGVAGRFLATTRLGLIMGLVEAVACLGYTLSLLAVLLGDRLTIFLVSE